VRPPDGAARGQLQHPLEAHVGSQLAQPLDHPLGAADPAGTDPLALAAEARLRRVEVVAEDVDRLGVVLGGQLAAGQHHQVPPPSRGPRLLEPGGGVVVGERDARKVSPSCQLDHLARAQRAVGAGRMGVEIEARHGPTIAERSPPDSGANPLPRRHLARPGTTLDTIG